MLTMTLTPTLSLELDVRQGAWIHARLNPHPNRDPNKQVPAPDFYAPTLSKELTVAKLVLAPLGVAHAMLPLSAATMALEVFGVGKGSKRLHPYVASLMAVGELCKWAAAIPAAFALS